MGWEGQQHSSGCVGWDGRVSSPVVDVWGGIGGISSPVVDVWGWDGRVSSTVVDVWGWDGMDQQHSSGCVGVGWEGSAAQ